MIVIFATLGGSKDRQILRTEALPGIDFFIHMKDFAGVPGNSTWRVASVDLWPGQDQDPVVTLSGPV